MEKVPHTCFSTDMVDVGDRFAIWQDSISVIFDATRDAEHRKDPFEAHIDAYMFDQIMVARTRSDSARYQRTEKGIRSDGVDMIMLQLFLHGEVQSIQGAQSTNVLSGDIVIFDLGKESRMFNTKFEHLTIFFPRELIEEYIPSISNWHGMTLPRKHPMTELLKTHILSIHQAGASLHIDAAAGIQRSLLEITATAIETNAHNLAHSQDTIKATALLEIKKFIRKNLDHPNLSPESIAQAFGLSRAKLYRITEPLDGIMNYIREQRLKRCMRELQNPLSNHLSITEIGFKWGFNDIGTFARNFKRHFGIRPTEARQSDTHTQLNNHSSSATDANRNYENWLRSLAE